ncbi:HelD family protein [Brevibacterium marinum]|uniref:DNA helicase IV n=1 Tax=Brevibacterium marinum TaxID=418643 RepID=A0A846RSZ0_9MICO|nr:UvrD-helicase domain-containing protein [Brevibacterium marinum]NJC57184.1 DNA helicase IV [Brevibacterium marinum]
MTETSELRVEQTKLDELYARLDELRDETTDRLGTVRASEVGGNHQHRSERDAFATLYEDQLIRLNSAEDGLCFGRLDLSSEPEPSYIGRIGLTDENRQQILIDWRAPASERFYQSTAANPEGVVRRRHLVTKNRRVTDLEDDVLDIEALDDDERSNLQGEGALIAALTNHRTGRMGDIVATIQAEQDAIIRQPLQGVLVVQGGPGTGKTAVALHRAAYLLYRHRERIAKSGVLLVGPSPVFLKYIEKVLPSLGETGALLLTPGQLYPGLDTEISDDADIAAIKGRSQMATVLKTHIANYERIPDHDEELRVGSHNIWLRRRDVRAARDRARRTGDAHNAARNGFVSGLLKSLAEDLAREMGLDGAGERLPELMEELRSSVDVRRALNLAWFPISPSGALRTLLSKPHKLQAAAGHLLSPAEQERLIRSPDAQLTVDDVPLLDELAELLGNSPQQTAARDESAREYAETVLEMTETSSLIDAETLAARWEEEAPSVTLAERAIDDREWTYGHLVVDEAQELTPMQWRILFRRVPSKSATVVGDLAQSSRVDNTRTWDSILSEFVGDRYALQVLTVSYRTPQTVMDLANRYLHRHFPQLELVESVRRGGPAPRFDSFASAAEAVNALVPAVAEEVEAVAGGKIAVIAPDHLIDSVAEVLDEFDIGRSVIGLDHQIAVISAQQAKGLEFDSVIIVEPGSIAPEGHEDGVGALYVSLTRTTDRLRILAATVTELTDLIDG